MAKQTMRQQYDNAKAASGGALLLIKSGAGYEAHFGDAQNLARVLGIRFKCDSNGVAFARITEDELTPALGKLVAAGYRAAVCERV